MLMQALMLFVLFVLPNRRGLFVRGSEICMPGSVWAYSTQRDHLSQIHGPAPGTFRRWGWRPHEVLKPVSTLPAFIFIDWHSCKT